MFRLSLEVFLRNPGKASMGICNSKGVTTPPLPSEETSEAVCMIQRQESQMLAARVRSFPVNILWKRYKSTMAMLGDGATSTVRVVTRRRADGSLGKKFALKHIDLSCLQPKMLESMRTEVNIMRQIDHPNIVHLHEVYEDKKDLYMILDLCDGGDLFTRIHQRKRFSEREASKLVAQMLAAIMYCHSKGIAHRDLKLENFVFKDREGPGKNTLVLIDFGLSQRYVKKRIKESRDEKKDKMSKSMSRIVGSAYYIAPEVVKGAYSNSCDLWSIGVLAFMVCVLEYLSSYILYSLSLSQLYEVINIQTKQKARDGISAVSR